MLKNSRLLKYVLDRAALISDGAGVSSNGFVLVLLALLADADMGRLPGELNSGDVKRELCDVKAVFYGLNFDVFDAISALGNEITSPDYDDDADCDLFRTAADAAIQKARSCGEKTVCTVHYLTQIISAPTAVICRVILGNVQPVTPSLKELLSEIYDDIDAELEESFNDDKKKEQSSS